MSRQLPVLLTVLLLVGPAVADEKPSTATDAAPAFQDVQPILRKYCAACHNDEDREGGLSTASHAALLKGGENGAVITPGHGELSRLVRVLTGRAEPKMPPKGSESPTAEEIARLVAWINAGARGPTGAIPDPGDFVVPKIPLTSPPRNAVHAVTVAKSGGWAAVARHAEIEIREVSTGRTVRKLPGCRGSTNALAVSADGQWLVAGGGEPNLYGEWRVWRTSDWSLARTVRGHRDGLQAIQFSPDASLIATGGYDQKIKLWDRESGAELRTFDGHNGPVFDLAFRPDGKVLASASGDRTVKLWDVATGGRLDTLNQALQELYCVAFAPDGKTVAAGGVDNRIRVWQVSASAQEGTNPLKVSQFAHELAVLRLAYAPDGQTIVSSSEDRRIKVWNASSMTIRQTLAGQSDWVVGLAIDATGAALLAGRLDGSVERVTFAASGGDEHVATPLAETPPEVDYGPQPPLDQLPKVAEQEPNDAASQATRLTIPAIATGRISSADRSGAAQPGASDQDVDLFRFSAKRGDQWVIETNAARSGSPLDTKIDVLTSDGRPVPRMLLRAVRDSEIEFRSMDSSARGVRLKNWEEMLLNEYVYLNGEVIKHFQQRRGPDADSQFYPESGARHAFFDTTARTHALGEPAYVVVPYPLGARLPENGLPVFTLNFENDDDSQRASGKDSKLTFVAPEDTEYCVRVRDVRGFAGEDFRYQLIVRRPEPRFNVTLTGANPSIAAGSGKSLLFKAERLDNFAGPIRIDVTGVPPGFRVTTPIVVQAGLYEARGMLYAAPDATVPADLAADAIKFTATADVAGKPVTRDAGTLGTIKLGPAPKVVARLAPDFLANASPNSPAVTPGSTTPVNVADREIPPPPTAAALDAWTPPVVTIHPGRRTTFRLHIARNGFNDRVQFDAENLPHGVIVDDIGLSGILIPEGQTDRTLFLSCEPWVPETDRLFHLVAKVDGDQVSLPLLLQVRK